jgi:hypothetical protein
MAPGDIVSPERRRRVLTMGQFHVVLTVAVGLMRTFLNSGHTLIATITPATTPTTLAS